ncbi:MAG: FAD-dependent oxidoreductase, partial [Pseudomonadota bacterium]
MDPIIVVGSGLAGYTLAKELRKKDKETPLTIISRDDGRFYSKPMLSNGLSKDKSADDLATQTAQEMADSLPATVLTHTAVQSIDTVAKSITCNSAQGEETLRYASLVLALGASQIQLPYLLYRGVH